jgi:hypothetical protein
MLCIQLYISQGCVYLTERRGSMVTSMSLVLLLATVSAKVLSPLGCFLGELPWLSSRSSAFSVSQTPSTFSSAPWPFSTQNAGLLPCTGTHNLSTPYSNKKNAFMCYCHLHLNAMCTNHYNLCLIQTFAKKQTNHLSSCHVEQQQSSSHGSEAG